MKNAHSITMLLCAMSCLCVQDVFADDEAKKIISAPNPSQLPIQTHTVKELSYKIPILSVSGEEDSGKISYMPFTFSRSKSTSPLRIMIADDTPNGSGKSAHSSLWLAATTAAMLKDNIMQGVTMTFEYSGNVDGPSAGGVTCLAIMSAMDGLPLPNDFAMTGTILPDGTIGIVGGIPDKIRGAAKAGVKKIFIPAFLRIMKDKKGKDVDLARLAEELKVKLYRVENIMEAYCILHGKANPAMHEGNVRETMRLPRNIEDFLQKTYNEYFTKVSEKLKKHPELSKGYIIPGYPLSPDLARDFYYEGKLFPATLQILRTWHAWLAWESADKFMENFNKKNAPQWDKIHYLREYHLRKLLLAVREESDKEGKKLFDAKIKKHKEYLKKNKINVDTIHGYFPFKEGQTPITAQLEPVMEEPKLSGILQMHLYRRPSKEDIAKSSLKMLEGFLDTECSIIRLRFLLASDSSLMNDFYSKLGELFPKANPNKDSVDVERLFYLLAYSTGDVADENFQSCMDAWRERSAKVTPLAEIRRNPHMMQYVEMQRKALGEHHDLLPDSKKKVTSPTYHTEASLKSQVSSFAMASAILVTYGADQANDFIPNLLRNARRSAIKNINACVQAGVPCYIPICDFEIADSLRDRSSDAYSVLMSYWRASLYSKALLMSFNQNKQN